MRMATLESCIRTESDEFRTNKVHNLAARELLADRLRQVRGSGPPSARERHTGRGKLLVRDRISRLLDPGSAFLELSTLAAWGQFEGEVPSSGLVTGIGRVRGREVMIMANDATVKGGTYYPITVKKNLRAQRIAMENRLPCIYLVDSGGAFLPLQSEIFPDESGGGRLFFNQARMSADGLPQVAAVMGSCTAGGAYTPAMCDEVVIVKGTGTIFLAGPPLVKAATGEVISAEELGGGDVHARVSGVADHLVDDDVAALERVRSIVGTFAAPGEPAYRAVVPQDPLYDPEELHGIVPADSRKSYDIREVLARLIDGSDLEEFKREYGPSLVTGFARIGGYTVGIVASNGVLVRESALKGAHFVGLCSHRGVPLVFIQNITGFMVGRESEQAGLVKEGAKMVHAVANAAVPRFTVIVGASYGAGNYAMCGRSQGPRFLWTWPSARIAVMGRDQAVDVLVQVRGEALKKEGRTLDEAMTAAIRDPVVRQYDRESDAYWSTSHLWDDGLIDPVTTRSTLILALAAASRAPLGPPSRGVLRH